MKNNILIDQYVKPMVRNVISSNSFKLAVSQFIDLLTNCWNLSVEYAFANYSSGEDYITSASNTHASTSLKKFGGKHINRTIAIVVKNIDHWAMIEENFVYNELLNNEAITLYSDKEIFIFNNISDFSGL